MRSFSSPLTALLLVVVLLLNVISAPSFVSANVADVVDKIIPDTAAGASVKSAIGVPAQNETAFTGLTPEQARHVKQTSERFEFQSEVSRLMQLIVHSLYKTKEIFLRELISNASDAIDKIRFMALTDKNALSGGADLEITVKADKKNRLLVIRDTGVGMTKTELKENLGTIAKSGTSEFLTKLEDKKADVGLIGQFGVGFYSIFLVADKVVVTTKNNADKQYIWESRDVSDFTIAEDPRGNTLGRGTEITLHIKEDDLEFLEEERLLGLIKKYSEFINFPIKLWTSKTEQVPIEDEEDEVKEEAKEEESDVEDVEEGQKSKEKSKTKDVTVEDWEVINSHKPLWTRDPKEITKEEYDEFYKVISKDTTAPLAYSHFKAEGEVEFKSIMYIPSKAPTNFYQNLQEKLKNVKLFVRRVFITDELNDLMPKYLAFIRALVDADDIPLNVSRETLQQHKMLKLIKKYLVRKALDMLSKLSDDAAEYNKFYKEFGTSVKLGAIEDASNRKKLSKLLRFPSSHDDEHPTSLQDYVDRMKKGQTQIYYLTGTSLAEIKKSPFVERLLARGFEVIYMEDAIDEYLLQQLPEFSGHRFQSVAKAGLKFGDEDEADKEKEKETTEKFQPLAEWIQKTLSASVEKVQISNRLTTSPCAIVANEYGWSGNMERIMRSQALAQKDDTMLNFFANQKKILEINPKHPLILGLLKKVANDQATPEVEEIARVLYETTLLRSGYVLKEHEKFASRVEKIMRQLVGVDVDLEAEQDEEFLKRAEEAKKPDAQDAEIDEVDGDEENAEKLEHDEL